MVKVDEFKVVSTNAEKFLKDIKTKVDYFTNRASNQDNRMKILKTNVDKFNVDFANKIDRLVKDISIRFNKFSQFNVQLNHLQTNFDHLKSN